MSWEGAHTCHSGCPCHTGGEPTPDFTPAELRPLIDGDTPSAAWPNDKPRWGYAQRTHQKLVDALERADHYQTQANRYAEALHLIAAGKRLDGTYNRDREACELLARKALEGD